VERKIWGTWPPPLSLHYLHLIRAVIVALATSVVASFFVYRMKKKESVKEEHLTRLWGAFEHSTDGILLTDLRGKILEVNQAFTRLFGYTREEACGNTTRILRSRWSTNEFYQAMWQSILTRNEWKGEIVNRAKDGEEIPVWLSITPVIHGGVNIGYMGVEIDMREKKDLERRALEAERLAAVGRLSSQVAHEVRNPLSSISLNVELLKEELDAVRGEENAAKVREARELLQAIEREVDRLSELAGEYLKFSRLPRHKKQPTNLNQLVLVLCDFLREEGRRRNIALVFKPGEDLAMPVDPKQMEQVLLNLISNAFDAMPQGGTVEVAVSRDGGHTMLFVRDEGVGMDEDTRRRIFEPFFTTKDRGSGLGLSVVKQVVAEHGGAVWCESAKGKGTTFFVRLPAPAQGGVTK
jgi:PAS domain S-box-containing protein